MGNVVRLATKRSRPLESEDASYYSVADAARLALISPARLKRWISIRAATPSQRIVAATNEIVASGFTLADVGYLHLLRHLIDGGQMPLEHAVLILNHLLARFGPPGPKWHEAVVGRGPGRSGVAAYAPDEWLATLAVPGREGAGQRYFNLLGSILPQGVTLESLLIPEQFLPYVEINPRKENGQPVVRGTRIATEVVRAISRRYGEDAVTRDYYPHIPPTFIGPAIGFEDYLDKAA